MIERNGPGSTEGRIAMFTEAPTAVSVRRRVRECLEDDENGTGVVRVLDELAFCMKTATRLGRVVTLASGWWGHPQSPGWAQMERVDWGVDDPEVPDDFDVWTVLHLDDLVTLVANRTGIPLPTVRMVIEHFQDEINDLEDQGLKVVTPTQDLALERAIEAELLANIEVLSAIGPPVTLHKAQMHLGDAGRADVVCRDSNGGWVVIELKRFSAKADAVAQLSRYLDAVSSGVAAPGEEVRGLIIADGDSAESIGAAAEDGRISHVNVRALDLPLCRAQRWVIHHEGSPAGWLAVAADGRTVLRGAGPAFPAIAPFQVFQELPLDWDHHALWALPPGDRSEPGTTA